MTVSGFSLNTGDTFNITLSDQSEALDINSGDVSISGLSFNINTSDKITGPKTFNSDN